MKLKELIDSGLFKALHIGEDLDRKLSQVYCCDLLSVAMSSVPADGVWVTVMGNINTLAVASLTDAACIVLAQDAALDEGAVNRAKMEGMTILQTSLPVFQAALKIHQLIDG